MFPESQQKLYVSFMNALLSMYTAQSANANPEKIMQNKAIKTAFFMAETSIGVQYRLLIE